MTRKAPPHARVPPARAAEPASHPATGGYDFTQQVGHLLRLASQRHLAIFQQNIPDSDLTAVQFVVLCALLELGPCSLNDLVRATAVDQGTARGVLERLKKRDLLNVAADPGDRRKVLISITDAGAAMARATVPFAERITEATLAPLNPGERVAVLYLLQKMSRPPETQDPEADGLGSP